MAVPTPGSTYEEEQRRAALTRRLASLNADNTPESLVAATGVAKSLTPPSTPSGQTVLGAADQAQRSGERSPFQATGSQLEEMQKAIADTAARNAALKTGTADPAQRAGERSSVTAPTNSFGFGDAITRRISGGQADPKNPLGIGATPASLGATGSAAVQRATGSAPNSPEVQRQLGSAPLSDEGQALLGAKTAPVTSLPVSRPTEPTPTDQTQRAGERSSVPAYDLEALKAEAARRAAEADAANAARTTTTTTQGVPPTQPPVVPPTTPTKPVTDTTTTADLLSKMTTQTNRGLVAGTGTGTGAGAGAGTGAGTSLPGGATGASGATSAQLHQQVLSDLQGIRADIARGPQAPDVMGLFLTQGKSLLDMLDKQMADLQAEGSTVDPMTQNTLDTLREELTRQLKETRESLNSRGLLESGILIEAEQMLKRGNMSDQAKILAERLSRIQANIQSLRSQKFSVANDWTMAGVKGQTQADAAERDRLERAQGRVLDTELSVAGRMQSAEQADLDRQFSAEQNDLQRRSVMAAKFADLAAAANDKAAERQWRSQEAELDRQFKESQQAQTASRSSGSRGSTGATGATSTTQATIADLRNTFATTEEAMSALSEPGMYDYLKQNDVDVQAVVAAAQELGHRRAGTDRY